LALVPFLFFLTSAALFSQSDDNLQLDLSLIKRAKIFQDNYPLITSSDIYSSFFVWEKKRPELRIIAAEKQGEADFLSDFDLVYINMGQKEGVEPGQVYLILEIGEKVRNSFFRISGGRLASRRGSAEIVWVDDHRSIARILNSSGPVRIGNCLIPREEKEGLLGKDEGYGLPPQKAASSSISFLYFEDNVTMIGNGYRAIIDRGRSQGLEPGQQLVVFRRIKKDLSRLPIASLIVTDVQDSTATVKVLSAKDALRLGDEIQVR
jgi:hypothetical protein